MIGVLNGFVTIAIVIAVGALVGHLGLIDLSGQVLLSRLAFFVATPALMLTMLSETHIGEVLSGNLVATAAGASVPFVVHAVVAGRIWRRGPGDRVIGALSSGYVNAGNLGIPVAAYALGNASFVVPTLLLQLLLFQPVALALLDADRSGRSPRLLDFAIRPLKNPLTLATIAGLVLAATGWSLPTMVWRTSRSACPVTLCSPSSSAPRCRRRRTSSCTRPATTGRSPWLATPSSSRRSARCQSSCSSRCSWATDSSAGNGVGRSRTSLRHNAVLPMSGGTSASGQVHLCAWP